jgi:hypothetical protein
MGFPEGQIQTFVYVCMDTHTSDSYAYSEFFDTDNDYIDTEGNHVFPKEDIRLPDSNYDNLYWKISKLSNSSLRQWWFWNNNTNSVKATLYTEEMFDLYYPNYNERIEDDYSINYLLQYNYGLYNNPPHTLNQQNGMIVDINGTLTLWTSNWWKTSYVKSNSDTGFKFPLYNSKLKFIEDGDENEEFLWVNANDINFGFYEKDYSIMLPIHIDIKPMTKILFLNHSYNNTYNEIIIKNLAADIISTSVLDYKESRNDLQTELFIFNNFQGLWCSENT